ncbi:putative kinetochore protein spc24 [Elasticomyces elasticus]|nr:putative kinetochore protein spc24 [Elasticomyces elasticus]
MRQRYQVNVDRLSICKSHRTSVGSRDIQPKRIILRVIGTANPSSDPQRCITMVLFDENPVTLISECTSNFRTTYDKDALSRISSSLSTLRDARTLRLQQQQNALKSLSRQHAALQSQHEYELQGHDSVEHANEVLKLDNEKFRIAKQVHEVEIEGERLSSEVGVMRGTLEELDAQGIEGGAQSTSTSEDEVILKLRVYRSLGIDLGQDSATGAFSKAVIRNTAKRDVNVVTVDPKVSRFFYAEYFWGSM